MLKNSLAAPRFSGSELGSESEPTCPRDTEREVIQLERGIQKTVERDQEGEIPSRQRPYLMHNTGGEARSRPVMTKLTRVFPDGSWQDMNRQQGKKVISGWTRQKDAGGQEGVRHIQTAGMTEWLSSNLIFPSKKE